MKQSERQKRLRHVRKLARETATWPARKLYHTYAQPKRVEAAEAKE